MLDQFFFCCLPGTGIPAIMESSVEEVESLVSQFFGSCDSPATNHEEWLLRLCYQLMEREVGTIRLLEQQAGVPKRWSRKRNASASSKESTGP